MSAKYDFYKNPSPKDSKKRTRYHARIVPQGTTTTDSLADKIQKRCTATKADVSAVLTSLADVVVEEMMEERRVYIKGLGYLMVTLQCPDIQSTKEIRSESIHFKSVAFRPEAELKKQLKNIKLERIKEKRHSSDLSAEQIDELLARHFAEKHILSRPDFERLCGYTRTTANRRLKDLLTAGKLQNIGFPRAPLYEAASGHYGKKAD